MNRVVVAAVATAVLTSLAAVAAAAWLVLGSPGAGDEPAVAVGTEEEFCAVFLDPFPLMDDMRDGDADFAANQVEYAERLSSAGLPRGVAEPVRHGLAVFVEQSRNIPGGALDDDLSALEDLPELSAADDAAYRTFDEWARDTCGAPY